jgi:PAS domain S-box-containing protein
MARGRRALGNRESGREAHRARQALQDHIDTLTTLTATVGCDGRLLLVNRTASLESGLDPAELSNTNFLQGPWFAYDEAVAARVREHFEKAAKGRSVVFEENLNLTRGLTPLLITFTPHIGKNGRVDYVLAEGRDLRPEREWEERLRKNQELLAEAQRVSHLGSFEWDIRRDRLECSEELYRIFGVTPEEFGHNLAAFAGRLHPDDQPHIAQKIEACLRGGEELSFDERIIRGDGSIRILQTHGRVIRNHQGEPVRLLGACQDVTELRQVEVANKKLAEAEQEHARSRVSTLETERELREHFVFALSHDVRTPLAVALTTAELIDRAPEPAERVAALSKRIIRSLRRADQMIQDFLDVTRIVAGNPLPLKVVPLDLAVLVEEVISEFGALHGNRFVMEGARSLQGYWSPSDVRRLVENLLANAVKYGEPEGLVTVTLRPSDSEVELEVHNRGEPIAPDELSRVFEPFRRAGAVERAGIKGWGLGLALVKAIAEAHGGRVASRSSSTEGTLFQIVLRLDARQFEQPADISRGATDARRKLRE